MLVQAGAARLALDDDTAAARNGLLAVERIGREATGDLRRLLGLLRTEDEHGSLQPAPGLDQLPTLIEQVTLAGLEVELETIGEQPVLSPSLSTSAYRIVQEALTNVLKHVGPSAVLIRLTYGDSVQIEVIDTGPRTLQPNTTTSGHGLVGMQERVALFGGRLRAARQGDGFAVRVELPRPEGLT
jgi:signal transduction histidine kinase